MDIGIMNICLLGCILVRQVGYIPSIPSDLLIAETIQVSLCLSLSLFRDLRADLNTLTVASGMHCRGICASQLAGSMVWP